VSKHNVTFKGLMASCYQHVQAAGESSCTDVLMSAFASISCKRVAPLRCRPHLAAAQERALADQADSQNRFRNWAAARVPGARHMNVGSGPQVC
jgi:hypothetical protein